MSNGKNSIVKSMARSVLVFIFSISVSGVWAQCMISFTRLNSVTPAQNGTQVTLSFNLAVPQATNSSFHVNYGTGYEYSRSGSGAWTAVEVNTTSVIVSNLTTGANYDFRTYTNSDCYRKRAGTGEPYDEAIQNDVSASLGTLTYPAAPTLTGGSSSNSTSVTFSWNAVSGAVNGYFLDLSTSSTFDSYVFQNTPVGTSPTTFTTANTLNPGTNYYYQVRAHNNSGVSLYSVRSTAVITRPVAPVAIAASAITTNSFRANWQTVASATGYRLDVSTSNDFTQIVTGYNDRTVSGLFHDVAGLSPGVPYFYRVRAVNANGASVNSAATISLITIPAAPVLNAPDLAINSFIAKWQTVTGALDYRLDVSTASDFSSFVTGFNDLTVSGTSRDVAGLNPGTQYYYRVRAVNNNGGTSVSTSSSLTTLVDSPTANAASSISVNSFRANWSAIGAATGYRLDVSTSDTFASFLPGFNDVTVAALFADVPGLAAGTIYYYRVRAVTAGGPSSNSNRISVITIPAAPVATNASQMTLTSFKANWASSTGASSYRLDVSADNFANMLAGYNNRVVDGTSEDVAGLTSGTVYSYRVRAINASGTSVNSNVISQITLSDTPALQPSTEVTISSFVGNWSSVTGAGHYELDVSEESSFNSFINGFDKRVVNGITQQVFGLVAGKKYYYRVRSINQAGASVSSLTGERFTLPAIPADLVPSDKETTRIKVQWQPVVSAIEYQLEVSTRLDFQSFVTNYGPKIIPSIITEEVVTGLVPSTVYYFRVRARNASGLSDYSIVKISNTLSGTGGDDNALKLTEATTYPEVHSTNQAQEMSVAVTGGNGTISVYVHHRKSAGASYVRESAVKSGSNYKIAVNDSWFDDFGTEFYFEAVDEGAEVRTSPHHSILTAKVVTVPLSSFGKDIKNYQLISVPYSIMEGNQINDVFEKIMGAYDTKKWRLSQYRNGTIVDYTEGLAASQLVQGQSYFFVSRSPVSLALGEGKSFGNSVAKPFKMNLKKGWNQIGNPFPITINWNQVLIFNDNPSGVDGLLTFNQQTVSFVEDNELKAFGGGFVFAENDIELSIPVTVNNPGGRTATIEESFKESNDDWKVSITLVQGEAMNTRSGIGMRVGSDESKDKWDRIAAPRFLRYLEFSTLQSGFEYDLSQSIVNPQDSYTWNYSVHSDETGPVVIRWDSIEMSNLKGQLIMRDLKSDVLLDMAKVSSYTTNQSGKFSIYYNKIRSVGVEQLSLGAPYPNPFRSQLTIPFDFVTNESKAEAVLIVSDLQGKVVARLGRSSVVDDQGIQSIQWDGVSDDGNVVPSGMYIYQLIMIRDNATKTYRGRFTKF
ncbi:MAG: hypothetical protein HOP08_05660 [Cyclobacteriaceae bacterium]|nr:hypothetical protein [Cyclobacteriaceae bacterium]